MGVLGDSSSDLEATKDFVDSEGPVNPFSPSCVSYLEYPHAVGAANSWDSEHLCIVLHLSSKNCSLIQTAHATTPLTAKQKL